MNYVVLILGMALITWVIRAAVFVLGERLRLSAARAHRARLRAGDRADGDHRADGRLAARRRRRD